MDFKRFSADFRTLNRVAARDGPNPLKWQTRLFDQLCSNDVPNVCDLPTGMGKTSIIHLWTLALRHQLCEKKPQLPTRLVYVVDRRTVVDQATEVAERIHHNLPKLGPPTQHISVSTLRGQFADNREWAADLARPAIIIGTVDLIGSRLLFSGYRSSYKQRPLDAGLLGQDTLLVLDEAHLSEPFEKLICALSDHGDFQRNQGRPMRVMRMSATAKDDDPTRFKLEPTDLQGDLDTNPIIQRYEAPKRLFLEPPIEKNKVKGSMIKAAVDVAKGNARVVVFVRKPEDASEIATAIGKRSGLSKNVEVLTGTMRGLERDELLKKPVLKRFLDGEEKLDDRSGKEPAILVSTSAGEVGFDLNADHMVCDAAPLDSMIQRLGRVNRRGYGSAEIRVFAAKAEDKPSKSKKAKSEGKPTWESAAAAAMKCLELARVEDGTVDASPRAMVVLKGRLNNEQLREASTPRPDTVELTDILLDAWSLTTITERMPGRPPVAPWLRGLTDEEPQTTISWRIELDLDGFGQLDVADIEEWFDSHRILPHETLSVPTRTAQDWMLKRWARLTDERRATVANKPCIVDCAGLQVLTIDSLVNDLGKRADSIRSSDIVLPASFGGIERGEGLLNERAPEQGDSQGDPLTAPDVADLVDGRKRYCLLCTVEDGVEKCEPLAGDEPQHPNNFARFTLDLAGDGETLRQLISLVAKRERPEYGTNEQTLKHHVGLVEKYAGEIAQRLPLSEDVSQALHLAAKWHDNGKDRERWQKAAGRKPGKEPLGKSGGSIGRIAGGYRHEFGSLREFDAYQGNIAPDVFDLAMHLIAAHHGRGRPHFPKGGFDPDARAKSGQIALDTVRRFARLQRRYGYWQLAWLENLLRCADAMASAEKDEHA
jgi:CRISPR-associated endonuclease/helicase Cas3